MPTDKKMWEQWKDWRLDSEKFEDYTNEEKETQKLNEVEYPKPKKITTLSELIKYGKGRSFAIPTAVEIHVGNRKKSGAIVSTDSGNRLIIK